MKPSRFRPWPGPAPPWACAGQAASSGPGPGRAQPSPGLGWPAGNARFGGLRPDIGGAVSWRSNLEIPSPQAMTFSGHRARKRFGQHWLTDPAVLERIVAAAAIEPGEHLLEVGPGRGALTERLLASPAASLLAVELDRDLVTGLRQRFGADPRFQLVEGDVLTVPLEPAAGPAPEKVVANIPYNITGPLLERLLGRLDRPLERPYRALVLLVQQEVGERIRATPGSSAYSALSVRLQLLARCRGVCVVPPRCFAPPPKVQSEVIRLEPLAPDLRPEPALARATEGLLRRCFAARRKMLRNTLAGLLPEGPLEAVAAAAGVALSQRPQELAPERWLALAAGLQTAGGLQPQGLQQRDHQDTDLNPDIEETGL